MELSEQFHIHRTRGNFPKDIDNFYDMATKGVFVVDRVVQQQMKGGVDLGKRCVVYSNCHQYDQPWKLSQYFLNYPAADISQPEITGIGNDRLTVHDPYLVQPVLWPVDHECAPGLLCPGILSHQFLRGSYLL